jgi:hypothetical protein
MADLLLPSRQGVSRRLFRELEVFSKEVLDGFVRGKSLRREFSATRLVPHGVAVSFHDDTVIVSRGRAVQQGAKTVLVERPRRNPTLPMTPSAARLRSSSSMGAM